MAIDLKNYNLLVVDDDDSLRSTLCDFFQDECAVVFSACNGKEALGITATKKVDLILSDIRMPVMDGVELVKALKSDTNISPIIWLMSGQSELNEEKALALGAEGLLNKPFRLQIVLDKFAESLEKRLVG